MYSARQVLVKPDKKWGNLTRDALRLSGFDKRVLTLYKRVLTLPIFRLKMNQKEKPFKLG